MHAQVAVVSIVGQVTFKAGETPDQNGAVVKIEPSVRLQVLPAKPLTDFSG